MNPLETAIAKDNALGKLALYFGCWDNPGHYLHRPDGRKIWRAQSSDKVPEFPWSDALLDTGLLKNGNHPDTCNGKVFWTCGGLSFWYAFFWWDRSGDSRDNSNSGLYVRGFDWPETQAAFDYGCEQFPKIVARQKHPLILQEPK